MAVSFPRETLRPPPSRQLRQTPRQSLRCLAWKAWRGANQQKAALKGSNAQLQTTIFGALPPAFASIRPCQHTRSTSHTGKGIRESELKSEDTAYDTLKVSSAWIQLRA